MLNQYIFPIDKSECISIVNFMNDEKRTNLYWLSDNLKVKIKKVFEAKYKRQLTDREVIDIAENLTGYMETIIKFKLRYENEKNNHDSQQA